MDFLATVIRDEEDLHAVLTASAIFAEEAGLEPTVTDFQPLLDWWQANKAKL